jgi:hypothetical protein
MIYFQYLVSETMIPIQTHLLRYGGSSDAVISILSKLHICNSTSTNNKMKDNTMNQIYADLIEHIRIKRNEFDNHGSSIYFLLLSVDNFHVFDLSSDRAKFVNELSVLQVIPLYYNLSESS